MAVIDPARSLATGSNPAMKLRGFDIRSSQWADFCFSCFAEKNALVVKLKLMAAMMAHTVAASRSPTKKRAASANMTINPDRPKASQVRSFRVCTPRENLTRRASWLAATAASNACGPSIAVSRRTALSNLRFSGTEACRRRMADTTTTMTDITNAARTSNPAVPNTRGTPLEKLTPRAQVAAN